MSTSFIIQQGPGAGAPDVEDGLVDLRFDGITAESHPDWAGPNKFGGQDDGERWRFDFTVLDEDGAVVYDESTNEPTVVSALTNQSMHKKSNGYAIMKGILRPAELAVVDAGQPFDIAPVLGRLVQGQIEHNASGWPKVVTVLPARKARKAAAE